MFKSKIFSKMMAVFAPAFICLPPVFCSNANAASIAHRALMSYCPSPQEATTLVMKNDEFFLEHRIDAVDANCKLLLVAPKNNKSEASKNYLEVIGGELVASKNVN